MEFDWSFFFSASALAVSLWNIFERWNDKQPRLFISDISVEMFHHKTLGDTYFRFDLTLNSLSNLPVPISRASVSMGKAQPCDCALHSPTPGNLDSCIGQALDRNRRLDGFFGPSVRFPATLPPSSAQHICLWLTLPSDSELRHSLEEALSSPMEFEASSSIARKPRISLASPDQNSELRVLPKHGISFLFRSGNCTLTAHALIDIRSLAPQMD